MATTAEQLERVQQAIAALESGKMASYSVPGGPSVTYANLDVLYRREKDLLSRLRREQGGAFTQVRVVPNVRRIP